MAKAYIEAYGCTLNQGEARNMRDTLRERGYQIAERPEGSDVVIIATCTVIEYTERKMLKRIETFYEKGYPLVVTGCLPAIQKEKVLAVAQDAELLPIQGIGEIEGAVKRAMKSRGRKSADWKIAAPKPMSAVLGATTGIDAIVPISQGCLGECTYCITRLARGKLRSRRAESILEDVKRALKEGAKELRLTAQDTAAYCDGNGRKLPDLLRILTENVEGDCRIRVGMMNPNSAHPILDSLIEAYADEKMYRFLHLPLQSGNDRLLKEMRRGYDVSEFLEIVERFRRGYPRMMLSTDIIVGFPGETEEEFRETMRLVEKVGPDIINVTRFSPRPGTPAARMRVKVPGWRAKIWSRELSRLRFDISRNLNARFLGDDVSVLATEHGKNGTVIGRTDEYRPVVLSESMELGERAMVSITDVSPVYLVGKLL